jgi:hypothetical protein
MSLDGFNPSGERALERLRQAGLEVTIAEGIQLGLTPSNRVTPELLAYATERQDEIRADLLEELSIQGWPSRKPSS